MKTENVATFNEVAPAETLKVRLQSAGIDAKVTPVSVFEHFWFSGKSIGGVRLEVPASRYKQTLDILKQWDVEDGALRDAVRCPDCGSARVDYPQFTSKFIMPNFIGLLAGLGIVEKQFYCWECHYTWPKAGKHQKSRPHSAPNYFIEGLSKRKSAKMRKHRAS